MLHFTHAVNSTLQTAKPVLNAKQGLLGCTSAIIIACLPHTAWADKPIIEPHILNNAQKLIEIAKDDVSAYQLVESLTTEVGPRLAGSEAEARARDWAVKALKSLDFKNIRIEPFKVPLWKRGIERAEILKPYPQALNITALGGSVSTPPEGITGEILALPSLEALKAQADGTLKGKVVFINQAMTRTQDGSGYSVAAAKRRHTAYEAYRAGASAALIRSVGTSSHRFAHTGQMRRLTSEDGKAPSVPTAALSAPDSDQLERILKQGKNITVNVKLITEMRPEAESGNVIAEIPGSEKPEEVILLGAHLDSWDLGTGAVDDGAGVGIVIAAAKLLMQQFPSPKRTIRIVLFGSEEVGLVGAKAYAEQHKDELDKHIMGSESDFGADNIWRFDSRVADDKLPIIKEIAGVLQPLGIGPGNNQAHGGPDMKYIREAGVPIMGLVQNGWDYFDLHHTANDTLDKISPDQLKQNVAAYAALIYLVSELDIDFR